MNFCIIFYYNLISQFNLLKYFVCLFVALFCFLCSVKAKFQIGKQCINNDVVVYLLICISFYNYTIGFIITEIQKTPFYTADELKIDGKSMYINLIFFLMLTLKFFFSDLNIFLHEAHIDLIKQLFIFFTKKNRFGTF